MEALTTLGASTDVFYFSPERNAPFDTSRFLRAAKKHRAWSPDGEFPWEAEIVASEPDILLVVSWHIKPYRQVAKRLRGKSVRFLCMDNQLYGTLRQYLGMTIAPIYVRPLYDVAFVPGPRQHAFARRLGFADDVIVEGHYSCNQPALEPFYEERLSRPLNRHFSFVGRLIDDKGVSVLKRAWVSYWQAAPDPWYVDIFGSGPLKAELANLPGVTCHDFVQPAELPGALLRCDVLILPSLYEPWGLILHEAASLGMAIICSEACGAGDLFVESSKNGFVIRTGDAYELSQALGRISVLQDEDLRAMQAHSFRLGKQRTPATWATAVYRAMATFHALADRAKK